MGLFCDLDSADSKRNGRSLGKRHFYLAQLADDLFRRVFPASHISPFSDSETLTLELDRFSGGRSISLPDRIPGFVVLGGRPFIPVNTNVVAEEG